MGFWAGIKYALNSTLGTSGFKPLNTMIDEAKTAILSEIDGQRSLAASDSVIRVLFSGDKHIGNSDTLYGSFVPKKSGSVRVSVTVYTKNSSPDRTVTVFVKQGANTIGSVTFNAPGVSNTITFYSATLDVPVSANASYEVYASRNNSGTYITTVALCASIVDTSLVEVL